MPELPEMETYRRYLQTAVAGSRIIESEILRDRSTNVAPELFQERTAQQSIMNVRRAGKQIIFGLASGDALLVHLMLGGWMYLGSDEDLPEHHSQVILTFDKGHSLFFLGLRLGYLHLYSSAELSDRIAVLGPNPLDETFDCTSLKERLRGKRGYLKMTLVDQHVIAGIGNCYSDEICFHSGIHPLTKVPALTPDQICNLHDAMRYVLNRAIGYGGYMEHPFTKDDHATGGYNEHCLVYDRTGEPCPRCGRPIIRTEFSKRKVFYCEHCQS